MEGGPGASGDAEQELGQQHGRGTSGASFKDVIDEYDDDEEDTAHAHESPDSKVLTGKYDMSILREIARIEEALLEELVEMYEVEDEDELPIEFDIHEFIDMDESKRPDQLREMLKGCPTSTVEFVTRFCDKIRGLNPKMNSRKKG